jgi:hypothetical protein
MKGAKTPRFSTENSSPVSSTHARYGDAWQLKPWQWKLGQSGNPGGRPKVDLAAEIARALFEQDGQAIFEAFRKVLRKGSPYAFQVLSDRAFGKLKETHAIELSPYKNVSDEDIEAAYASSSASWYGRNPSRNQSTAKRSPTKRIHYPQRLANCCPINGLNYAVPRLCPTWKHSFGTVHSQPSLFRIQV